VIILNGFQKKTQKTPKTEIERALKLKHEYYENKNNITTFEEFLNLEYGKIGTPKRDKYEQGFEAFKLVLCSKR